VFPLAGKISFPRTLPDFHLVHHSRQQGWLRGRKRGSQILVALNPETAKQDISELDAGGAAIYEESFNLKQYRDDVACYPVPFDKITAAICPEAKLRKLVRNMVYVGVVAQLLSLDLSVVESACAAVCQKAEGLRPELRRGQGWIRLRPAESHQAGPYFIEAQQPDRGKIIIDGNAAAAWAQCLRALRWLRGIPSRLPPRHRSHH